MLQVSTGFGVSQVDIRLCMPTLIRTPRRPGVAF